MVDPVAVWPSSLPQTVLVKGYSEQTPSRVLESAMDAGRPKARPRFTAAPRPIAVQVALTPEQVAVLDDFHENDLHGGALSFHWCHPRTLASAVCRIKGGITYTRPSRAARWLASFKLEIVP